MNWIDILASLCSGGAGEFSLFLGIERLIITGQYMVVATQFGLTMRYKGDLPEPTAQHKSKARHSLLALVAVFVLCAFSGYLSAALSFPVNALIVLHGLLIVATQWFITTRRAAVIMAVLA